jgi:hypothetical protein
MPDHQWLKERIKLTWLRQSHLSLKVLIGNRHKLFISYYNLLEGDSDVLHIEWHIRRFLELLKREKTYDLSFYDVRNTAWWLKMNSLNISS